jgi:uncharacterized protein (DUF697 family)
LVSGGAPKDPVEGILEALRALIIILGLSMFFSIISSILSASEELRITFPLTKTGSNEENDDTSEENSAKKSTKQQEKTEDNLETP